MRSHTGNGTVNHQTWGSVVGDHNPQFAHRSFDKSRPEFLVAASDNLNPAGGNLSSEKIIYDIRMR